MYECPNCGSNVKYHIPSQMMKCESCDSMFEPTYFEAQTTQSQQTEYFDTMVYTCPQCGGELIGDVNEAAVFCSYCGTSNILESKLIQSKRPKYIIPFSRTKEDCKKEYSNYMKRAIFAPKELKNAEFIDGFRAIYMPYWSYNIQQKGPVSLFGTKEYRRGDYIYTDSYTTKGYLDAEYDGYSMDAASTFDDNLSQAIAPFDYAAKQPFTPAYMSGFYADVADVEQTVYESEALEFALRESTKAIKATPGVDGSKIDNPKKPYELNTKIDDTANCMYPVWFLSYRNKDRVAYAAVNGQSGKVAADVPIDIKKYIIGTVALAIPLFIILNLFLTLRPKTLVIATAVLSAIAAITYLCCTTLIEQRESGISDKGVRSTMGLDEVLNNNKENNTKKLPKKLSDQYSALWFHPYLYWLICLVVDGAMVVMSPVSDIPYYLTVVLNAVYMLAVLAITIVNYNHFATRPLPQFNRKGGDDNA